METTGRDPRHHRIVQFAGVRTTPDLAECEPPLVSYCQLSDEVLPEPGAVLVTGITPTMLADAPSEAQLIAQMIAAFAQPGTCAVGFNSLRFDDEFVRYSLWRCLRDPYAREFRNGNSRWDLLDLARATRALRPAGVAWPTDQEGRTRFNLEALARANNLEQHSAHDALSDTRATLALGRLLRQAQPRLFDYYLSLRDRNFAGAVLGRPLERALVHVSGHLSAATLRTAVVVCLGMDPRNRNAAVVLSLQTDPAEFAALDPAGMRERMFAKTDQLGDLPRLGLKDLRLNRSPFIARRSVLTDAPAAEHLPDAKQIDQRLGWLRDNPDWCAAAVEAFCARELPPMSEDPDASLYGGFLSDRDRAICERLATGPPAGLAGPPPDFGDPRLEELLFRLRARNYRATLDAADQARWAEYVDHRWTSAGPQGMAQWRQEVAAAGGEGGSQPVLDAWVERVDQLQARYQGRHHVD